MNKKVIYIILGLLCVGAAIAMYQIGSTSSHLSELKDFWYVPLPLGAVLFMLALKGETKK